MRDMTTNDSGARRAARAGRATRSLGVTLAVAVATACAATPPEPLPEGAAAVEATDEITARVEALRARFVTARGPTPTALSSFIGRGTVQRFARSGDALVPAGDGAEPLARQGLDVRLPVHANGETRLSDRSSGVAVRVRLEGAGTSAPAALGSGIVVYEHATPGGATILVRATRTAVEDYVVFDARPEREAVVYSVQLEQVAGLRLVASTLELLDAEGTPRLRVAPPEIADASGRVHAATLEVDGCKADVSPVTPWGRAVTPPGSSVCAVRVRWDHASVQYPAVLDPKWSATSAMVQPRRGHSAVLMQDGRVLVTGMRQDLHGAPIVSEVFEPGSQTWAVTSPLNVPRYLAPGVLLDDGRVLVVGGVCPWSSCPYPYLPQGELYDPKTGVWQPVPGSPQRGGTSATKLLDGRVLAVSGTGTTQPAGLPEGGAYVFDPASNGWKTLPDLPDQYLQPPGLGGPGMDHTASLLHDGRVLVVGGWRTNGPEGEPDKAVPAVAAFDPKTDTWAIGPPLHQGRLRHVALTLPDGRLLVAGGDATMFQPVPLATGEIFDPATNTWTTFPATPRSAFAGALRQDGTVLLAGGEAAVPTAELIDPATLESVPMEMPGGRYGHTATALADGRALVAGGYQLIPDGEELAEPSSLVLSNEPLHPPVPDAGTGGVAGAAGAAGHAAAAPDDQGGCGCRVAGPAQQRQAPWALAAALALWVFHRRGGGKKATT